MRSLSAAVAAGAALLCPGPASAAIALISQNGMSDDGRSFAFSTSKQLLALDDDNLHDGYLRTPDGLELVTRTSGGANTAGDIHGAVAISADGTRVLFESPDQLVPQDGDGAANDVYLFTLGASPAVQLVSTGDGAGANGTAASVHSVAWTRDLTRVAMQTNVPLSSADENAVGDVYVRDIPAGSTTFVSTGGSAHPAATFAGADTALRRIVFSTAAALDSARDFDAEADLYRRLTEGYRALSEDDDNLDGGVGTPSFNAMSADGDRVYFTTADTLGLDPDTENDIVMATDSGVPRTVSDVFAANTDDDALFRAISPELSDNCFEHVFWATKQHYGEGDTGEDLQSTRLCPGLGANQSTVTSPSFGNAAAASVSFRVEPVGGGETVAFATSEALVAGDTDTVDDVYVRVGGNAPVILGDTGATPDPAAPGVLESISADGSRVIVNSRDSFGQGDSDGSRLDLYAFGVGGNLIERMSTGPTDGNGVFDAIETLVSPDARTVSFITEEKLTGTDTDTEEDVYSRSGGVTRHISGEGNPPDTSIASGPGAATRDTTPSYSARSDDPGASFECSVDGASFASCSSEFTTEPLTDGTHSVRIRSRDQVGNADPSPASQDVRVDTTAPRVAIGKVARLRKGRLRVSLRCDADDSCAGTLVLRTRKKARLGRASAKRKLVRLGRAKFSLGAGQKSTLKAKVPRKRRGLVRRLRRKRSITALVTVADPLGNSRNQTRVLGRR